jgi:PKD repeat protein
MTSIARATTRLVILGGIAAAALTWTARASATVSCDGSWTDDRSASSPTITFPNSEAYSPSEILINQGQTVVWEGNTAADTFQKYPLVDTTGKLWGTFSINEQSWPFRYAQPGAWEYDNGSGTLPAGTMAGIVCVAGPPIASFTPSPAHANPNQTVTFDATASHAAETFASITDYQWDLGSGTFTDSGTTPTASHAFAKAGIYTIRLKATDSLGASAIQTQRVPIGAVITQPPKLTTRSVKETSAGKVPLTVRNPNPVLANGKASLKGSAKSGLGRIGSTTFTAPANGTSAIKIALLSPAKQYLKHHKTLTAKATIILSRNGTSRSGTWTITIGRG